jgi:hypothetical protein
MYAHPLFLDAICDFDLGLYHISKVGALMDFQPPMDDAEE